LNKLFKILFTFFVFLRFLAVPLFVTAECFLPTALHSQWTKQTIPVTKPIVGIEFTDSLRGWACTNHGTAMDRSYVIRTTNGGTNWAVNYDSAQYNFYAMDVVNDSTVYIVGSSLVNVNGLLIKTTNRGVTWINMNIPVGLIIEDVFAPSKDTVYICSSNSFAPGLWFTSNGGVSWQVRTSGLAATAVTTLFFLNNNTGWCGTTTGRISMTTNSGLNWVQIGMFTDYFWSIHFLNENTGWTSFAGDKIRFTSNGGLNWLVQPNPQFSTVTEFKFFNSSTGYSGTGYITIYKTTDGGNNWGYQIDSSCVAIYFDNEQKGWSADSRIYHTTNGGGPISYVGIISNYHNIPKSHSLSQNYPNPFNSQTIIRFAINKTSYIKLRVFDILGKERTLWESDKHLGAGTHELSFDAKDLSSGVYFYQLIVSDENGNTRFKDTRKMVLVK